MPNHNQATYFKKAYSVVLFAYHWALMNEWQKMLGKTAYPRPSRKAGHI